MMNLLKKYGKQFKKITIVTFGSILVAVGIYFFIMDYQIPLGGISGFAIALQNLFPKLQVGYVMTTLNILLFILSYIFLGKEYVGYTLYSSLIVSNTITLLENLVPLKEALTSNILLSVIIGVILSGLGIAIVITQNATTGGTEILASIINKYTNIDIGRSIMFADGLVVLFGIYAVNIEVGLYALVGLGLNTLVINWAISGLNTKINMVIITEKFEIVNKFIIEHMERGSTVYLAEGGFSRERKQIINTIVSRSEYFVIKNYVSEVDPKAFVIMNYVNEVVGEGFTHEPEDLKDMY
ncbi:YitT family protein [Miniphocaeibacter halophilus]|uniref:YitT family protein n=1 Tax=Miniphocaeibacter halophilus TaxID=2931922 RepID=A0AC61MPJ3_9FIRM|nr:YitT family protein [Miniphocaeibacter halophilus]QQK07477.1 YitT family protein [Miniphocaeibacter halophilus]